MSNLDLHLILKFIHRFFNPFIKNGFETSFLGICKILLFTSIFLILQIINRLFLFLDNLIFFRYRKIPLTNLLFIVGVPRSGTTFLHNILSKDRHNFTCCTLIEVLLAPSIIQKLIFKTVFHLDKLIGNPIKKIIGVLEQLIFKSFERRHKTSFNAPEEDFMLLFPYMACFLLVIPYPFDEMWDLAFLDKNYGSHIRKKVMRDYKSLIQRHMFVFGKNKIYLSKNASFCGWIDDLRFTFPGIKFICCIRKPEESIPSILSVMNKGWNYFNYTFLEKKMYNKVLEMMEYYYDCIVKQDSKVDRYRWMVLPMIKIQKELEQTISEIYKNFRLDYIQDYGKYIKIQE